MEIGTIVKTNKRNLMHKALRNQLFEITGMKQDWFYMININTKTEYKFRKDEIEAIKRI